MKLAKVVAILAATSVASACGIVAKEDDSKDDRSGDPVDAGDSGGEDVVDDGADNGGSEDVGGDEGGDSGDEGGDGGDSAGDDGDDHSDPTVVYNATHLVEVQKKAVQRFQRLGLEQDATVELIKTWFEPGWVWARLVYKTTENGEQVEKNILMNCHSHGDIMGCHKQDETSPNEPIDVPDDDDEGGTDLDLPPIDDLLR